MTAKFNIYAPYANISRLKFRITNYLGKLIEPSDRPRGGREKVVRRVRRDLGVLHQLTRDLVW